MDLNQASQMLNWLDEEHRRDKQLLVELRQKVESQTVEIDNQSKRIQELEGRLANTQARLSKFGQIEKSIQQVRDELIGLIHEQEEELEKSLKERSKARQRERESLNRSINELRRGLEPIPSMKERLDALRAEDQRLGEQVMDLQTRLTNVQREIKQYPDRFSYLENQRSQDQKNISTLQEEVIQLLRRTEQHTAKLELIEELARKNEQNIATLKSLREDLRKEHDRWLEDAKLREADRERKMQDWAAAIQEYEEQIKRQRTILERAQQRQEEVQQYLAQIEEFKKELERAHNLTAEKQRLAEERQRREFDEWQSEQEQRWSKFTLEREAKWSQLDSRHEAVTTRIEQLENHREEDLERAQQLARELLDTQQEYRTKVQQLWDVLERMAAAELEDMRRRFQTLAETASEQAEDGH